jgi:hypothetical protein
MGARGINNSRETNVGTVEAFPFIDIRELRKLGVIVEGERARIGLFPRLPLCIFANLLSLNDSYLTFSNAEGQQDIPLKSRPNTFGGRRWYFVDEKGKLCEKLYFVAGRFVSRKSARLTYRSQSMGELDTILRRREKLRLRLEGTYLRGPARGRKRYEIIRKLEWVEWWVEWSGHALDNRFHWRMEADERRRKASKQRLEDAAQAMAVRRDVTPQWVVDTFAARVDELKNGAQSQRKRINSNSIQDEPAGKIKKNVPHIDIGILGRLGYVRKGQLLGDQLGCARTG